MNISKTMQDAINSQIQKELYSSYLYLAMAAHFEAAALPGCATWMRVQADEERAHAMKFFDYLVDRGGRVVLEAIQQPKTEYGDPMSVFEEVLAHEQYVTQSIHDLYTLATKENDYASMVMLQWFINEQVEEEKNANAIVDKFKIMAEKSHGILYMDHDLAKRGKD